MSGRCLALLMLVAVCGCRAAVDPPAAPRGAIPAPATEYLVKEGRVVNGLVAVRAEMPPGLHERRPVVVTLLGNPHELVAAGFIAVSYEVNWNRLRGVPTPTANTVGSWVLASPSADVLGQAYLRDVARNAEIVTPVLDWVATLPEADMAHVGIAGASTHGFAALQAAASDQRLRAAVAIAACGDYHGFLRDSSMGVAGQPLALAPAYEEWLQAQEVVRHPDRLVHAAVLMINRAGDRVIPIGCADETARALREAYARAGASERFEYVRLDDEGHGLGPAERQAAFDWLRRWLQP
ncbi:MAG: prolyl oligopeptidase family serine peptidase [Deltaproteobacteria bacterium]|nr:prolyl oligopeptidase family serine peptidase [Deltaproteobacteria bacterium]